jgi:hypothetical protein
MSLAVSEKGLAIMSRHEEIETLTMQRVITHVLVLPPTQEPGFLFEPVSLKVQCFDELVFRASHEILKWRKLPRQKAPHVVLICRYQKKRIRQDLRSKLASVYSSDNTWMMLDMKLDLQVIIPGHPAERKYRNVNSLVPSAEWHHRSNRLMFLDFSTIPNFSNMWQQLPPVDNNELLPDLDASEVTISCDVSLLVG